MTVEDSSTPVPPAVPNVNEFTAQHDQLLQSLVIQLSEMSARVEVLEAQLGVSTPPARSASRTTPAWRTKTARQTGWQPARR